MELAMIGLGKMGGNMARRLLRAGHRVVGYNRSPEATQELEAAGGGGAYSLEEAVSKLTARPRVVWVMVPAGKPTEDTLAQLGALLHEGDIVIDGGNSNYHETIRHAEQARAIGLHFVDVGTSGGVWGLTEGYSMMVGGETETVQHLRPIFETLAPAPDKGWGHMGPSGSGHYVKMVHNGIEYGIMQAYAEGFELMQRHDTFALDLAQIAEVWRHGSVVRSWLLDLTAAALAENPTLDGIAAYVPDSGEGRWTIKDAIDMSVSTPVMALALMNRFRSRTEEPFSDKLLAAMRNQFGGHAIKRSEPTPPQEGN